MKISLRRIAMGAVATTAIGCATTTAHADATITIATVNNGDMVIMQGLSNTFEQSHPGIHLRWVVFEENTLRQRLTTDIATDAGQFDVLTIGNYDAPIWAKQGWLSPLDMPASYDVGDLLKPVRDGLTYKGQLYGLPFYAESAMTYYRSDLFRKAGLTMPAQPTYAEVRGFADRLTDKAHGIYGMCLRGKPGWGLNMATVTSMVHAFGGQWFDTAWRAQIDTPSWRQAVGYYVDILQKDGPPGATSNGFNENLALFAGGHCAMWIDATVAAGSLYDKKSSSVADSVAFAPMPTGSFTGGPTWLWSWNLAIPRTSHNQEAAKQFVAWATSKQYVQLVAQQKGWVAVPPGTRASTYASPEYKQAAPFAGFVVAAIDSSNPNGQTKAPRPATGAQFVAIPEFQGIGTQVGQIVASALAGQTTVEQALRRSQSVTDRTMRQAGYSASGAPSP